MSDRTHHVFFSYARTTCCRLTDRDRSKNITSLAYDRIRLGIRHTSGPLRLIAHTLGNGS